MNQALQRRIRGSYLLLLRSGQYFEEGLHLHLLFYQSVRHFCMEIQLRNRPCMLASHRLDLLQLHVQSCLLDEEIEQNLYLRHRNQLQVHDDQIKAYLYRV